MNDFDVASAYKKIQQIVNPKPTPTFETVLSRCIVIGQQFGCIADSSHDALQNSYNIHMKNPRTDRYSSISIYDRLLKDDKYCAYLEHTLPEKLLTGLIING